MYWQNLKDFFCFKEKCLEVKAPCRSLRFIVFLQKQLSNPMKTCCYLSGCSFTHNPELILNFKVLLKIDFYAKSVDVRHGSVWRVLIFMDGRNKKKVFHIKHIINILAVSSTAARFAYWNFAKVFFLFFVKQQCHSPSLFASRIKF